ncbi:MAG TPA: pitrilysin family protein [Candidatus Marinimicrobia bacterium]|nr:pitrilysin family protein [Candidatus Neomarinimicrobiota bacterium]HRS51411.1 pitrilysin family protein [Candidatus Neomarinimicrobiota bacterium]HRU92217.1 pitrilysin family protein [Candidatus Neomarinimicrobiota bacterium]
MKTKLTLLLIWGIMTSVLLFSCSQKIDTSRCVLLPVADDPTISFRIYFKVGSQDDPAGKEGLAFLTAHMLSEAATQINSYEEIIAKLFPLAASYDATVSAEMTVISGRVHKDNLSAYYPLFTEAILEPAFQEDDLNRLKSNALNYLENVLKYANDEELGKAVLYNEIFAGTGYGHPTEGLINSINSISINDVKDFYQKMYNRNNIIIGLGGGYDNETLAKLQQDLAQLPRGAENVATRAVPYDIQGLKVTIVEKDANASAISLGFPINITRENPEWYALAVANSWFGEHRNSSSHLYQVIRETRGLNYGDYSYIEHFPNSGYYQFPPVNVARHQQIFEIWIRPVPNEARHFVLRATMRELHNFIENGLTPEQFNLTRNFLRKYILHYAPTTMMRLGYAIDDKFYGIEGSHLEKLRNALDNMTVNDVNSAIRKYLQYDNLQIVIVTNEAEKLREDLLANTPSPIKYAAPKPEAVLKEDNEIANYPLAIRPENIKIVNVRDLFYE